MRPSTDLFGVDPKRWKRMAYEDVWNEKLSITKKKLDELQLVHYTERDDPMVNKCLKDISFFEAQLKELE